MQSGKWVKTEIPVSGIYKISYQKLRELGFHNPENVRIFCGNAGMLPFMNAEKRQSFTETLIHKAENAIYFYANGTDTWSFDTNEQMYLIKNHLFSDVNYYFISDVNTGIDNAVKTSNVPTNQTISEGDFYYCHEEDLVNLQMSGRDWFGENFFYNTSQNFTFNCQNPPSTGKIKFSAIARSSVSNNFTATVANSSKTGNCDGVTNSGLYASRTTENFEFLPQNSEKQEVNITFNKNSASAEGYLDYIILNTTEPLNYNGQQMIFSRFFSSPTAAEFQVNSENLWNITDYTSPISGKNVNSIEGKNDFIAFNFSDAFEIEKFEKIENQNLLSLQTPEYLIITPQIFLPYAEKLKQIHSDLKTEVITAEKIYNEFSSGKTDVSAIRDFIRFLYKKQNGVLKYVLLFGDGSVDNKTKSENNTNLLPTYQSPNSLNENNLNSFVSDDFFGFLDDDEGEYSGSLDIGIGRLPASTTQEAEILVKKITSYLSTDYERDWKRNICFIADDEDNTLHAKQADYIAETTEKTSGEKNIKKIYIDAYKQISTAAGNTYPEARKEIVNTFTQGAFVINYTGHGGMNFFADERILTNADIKDLKNQNRLPLFITASCNIGHFDYYDKQSDKAANSPAEYCLKNSQGGAIAMFTTTRNVLANENFELNKNIFKFLFDKENRLGDVIRKAKNETQDNNMLNFTLLGDPALKLEFPEHKIQILKINDVEISKFTDTLKALGKYKILAEILSEGNFSGSAYISVFDKPQKITTLNNDGNGAFEYQEYKTKIFEGVSSVKNGKFCFKFIVPKDIDYNCGFGKITMYAENKDVTAEGFFKELKIGKSAENSDDDKTGPEIQLHLDDNYTLFAELSDSSGINITKKHSGHDIMLTIDDNDSLTYSLTDYYKPEKNSYTSGKLEYSLKKLSQGNHTLKLKAWDNFNNSSEEKLDFFISGDEKLTISHLLNYPNPFTDQTKFYFEHNSPQGIIDYELTVFSTSGKIIKVLTGSFSTSESLSEPVIWDGRDKNGQKIASGVYFYRLKIKNSDGKKASKYEKLLKL
ncbi:MAG: type IX secretion system sortase PorU [Bacteroidales bacterium]|nr:type IX secretion system sortase PorU [Bacteroidales bacterium]